LLATGLSPWFFFLQLQSYKDLANLCSLQVSWQVTGQFWIY
jgi:hypothetical protein